MRGVEKRRIVPGLSAAALAAGVLLGPVGEARAQAPSPEEIARMQEEMARVAKPGPEHEGLMGLEGEWRWESTVRTGPGAAAMTSTGVARARPILGGRFLVLEAETLEGEGTPDRAYTVLGFDRRYNEYTAVALDTWGTYWVTARGPWNQARDAAVMAGQERDPILGHTQIYDFVLSFPEPGAFRLEIVFKDEAHTKGQGSLPMVSTTYRRRGR